MDELLNKAPCGFLVVRDDGGIVEVNKTLLDLLGYKRKELINLHIEKIFSVGGRIFYQTHFFPLLKLQRTISEIYLDLMTKEGKTVPVLVNAVRHDRGAEKLNDCIFVPIYQRNKFEDELLLAKKEAEKANRAKDEFLSVVSHELRTPLNAILGWARILKNEKTDSRILKKGLETIQRNARMQTQLIEDILDFSRIISGRLRLEVGKIDLEKIIEDAIDVVTPAANAKNINLQKILDSNAEISGDADRIVQVLWNLLTNAVKFTPQGGRVQIRTKRVKSSVEISVSDTGQGISEDYLPYVFERFEQKDKTKTRRHGGLGLGLAITRHLVELHGGTIRAESPGEGYGATFTVRLPVSVVHRNKNPADPEIRQHLLQDETDSQPHIKNRLRGVQILYVDDEADARELISHILTKEGAQVTVAKSVFEAMKKLPETNPDLIISDIEMPSEDGFSLIKKLNAFNQKTPGNIPAIALTAHARPPEGLKVLSAGFKMHLAKPFEPEELITMVKNFVR